MTDIWPQRETTVTITALGSDLPVVGPQQCSSDGSCVLTTLPPGDYPLSSPTVTFPVGDMPDAGGVQLFVRVKAPSGPPQGSDITFSIVTGETTRVELSQIMYLPSEVPSQQPSSANESINMRTVSSIQLRIHHCAFAGTNDGCTSVR